MTMTGHASICARMTAWDAPQACGRTGVPSDSREMHSLPRHGLRLAFEAMLGSLGAVSPPIV